MKRWHKICKPWISKSGDSPGVYGNGISSPKHCWQGPRHCRSWLAWLCRDVLICVLAVDDNGPHNYKRVHGVRNCRRLNTDYIGLHLLARCSHMKERNGSAPCDCRNLHPWPNAVLGPEVVWCCQISCVAKLQSKSAFAHPLITWARSQHGVLLHAPFEVAIACAGPVFQSLHASIDPEPKIQLTYNSSPNLEFQT